MQKYLYHAAIAALALCPAVAMADVLSYNYIQLTGNVYANVGDKQTTGGTDIKGDGLGLAFGWSMGPYLFADGRFDSFDLDSNVDGTEGSLRLGVRNRFRTMAPWKLDGYATVSYEYRKFDAGSVSLFDESGYGLSVGLRASPVETFEFMGEVGYQGFSDFRAGIAKVAVQWNITPWFGANVGYRYSDYIGRGPDVDLDVATLGLRFQFGGG